MSRPELPEDACETDRMLRAIALLSALPETFVYRQNTGAAFSPSGRMIGFGVLGGGDIVVCRKGRAIQIEMKSRTGKQRKTQARFQPAWEKSGGIYIISKDPEFVLRAVLDAVP